MPSVEKSGETINDAPTLDSRFKLVSKDKTFESQKSRVKVDIGGMKKYLSKLIKTEATDRELLSRSAFR